MRMRMPRWAAPHPLPARPRLLARSRSKCVPGMLQLACGAQGGAAAASVPLPRGCDAACGPQNAGVRCGITFGAGAGAAASLPSNLCRPAAWLLPAGRGARAVRLCSGRRLAGAAASSLPDALAACACAAATGMRSALSRPSTAASARQHGRGRATSSNSSAAANARRSSAGEYPHPSGADGAVTAAALRSAAWRCRESVPAASAALCG